MKRILFILIIGFAFMFNINAQDNNYTVNANKGSATSYNYPSMIWNFDYSMAFSIGEFNDFINEPSFRGFYMDGRGMLNDKISIGGGIGWNVYDEAYERSTYQFDGGAITGKKWDYFFFMPLFVNTHYYFTHNGPVQPRVGLNFGGYYTEYEVQMGTFAVVDKMWKFGFTPEVELYFPFGTSEWGINVRGKYNYVFYNDNNINGLQNITLDVGFTFAPH